MSEELDGLLRDLVAAVDDRATAWEWGCKVSPARVDPSCAFHDYGEYVLGIIEAALARREGEA